jgi:hypothetical protein
MQTVRCHVMNDCDSKYLLLPLEKPQKLKLGKCLLIDLHSLSQFVSVVFGWRLAQ